MKQKHAQQALAAMLILSAMWAMGSLAAQNKGEVIAFVSKSNAGFEKDVIKNLKKDARRSKASLTIQTFDDFLKTDLAAYNKIALIGYISDMQGPLLEKVRSLQGAEPQKYALWLTYTKTAPPLPEGIDADTSASKQSYSRYGYGKTIVPHLF